MLLTRVIPTLLVKGNSGLYKGTSFANHKYVGDPMNAIRIFNQKQVDELCLLDITATLESRCISFELVERIAGECFMPLAVGGGIKTLGDVDKLLRRGAEKVILNSSAFTTSLVSEIANKYGSQAVVVSIDFKSGWFSRKDCYTHSGTRKAGLSLLEAAHKAQELGAGEILLTSIDREGKGEGFDLSSIREVTSEIQIPVIAAGGAKMLDDFRGPIREAGAHAIAVGRMFTFHGPRQAVLISYPDENSLQMAFK